MNIKHKLVKSAVSTAMILTMSSTLGFASERVNYINDGRISVSGIIENGKSGDKVTMILTEKDFNILNYDEWSAIKSDKVVQYNTAILDADKKYSFDFELRENGVYNIYIGNDTVSIKDYEIEYSNKVSNDEAILNLKSYVKDTDDKKSDVEDLLRNKRNELRLYTDVYEKADLTASAEAVYNYLKAHSEFEYNSDSVKILFEKALSMTALNNGGITNVEAYINDMGISTLAMKYYNAAYAGNITAGLKQTAITSIENYDSRVTEEILVSAINNADGIQTISDILTDYTTLFAASGKITNNLCRAIVNRGNFTSVNGVKQFIADYVEPSTGGNGGGNNVSGGGSSSGSSSGGISIMAPPSLVKNNQNSYVQVFNDVPAGFWASKAIQTLYENLIVTGKGDGEFCPNDLVSREEFVTLLVKTFKFDVVGGDLPFVDVSKDAWFYDYVKSAYLAYVVKGVSETNFGAGMQITRQDIAVMIANALKESNVTLPEKNEEINFIDSEQIADYAKEAVLMLQKAGVISGYEDNSFNPRGNATRAEAAQILYNIFDYVR